MKTRHSYIGKLNGVSGVWCDVKPEGLELEREVEWYQPDDGKVFTKDGELFDSVVLQDGETIDMYVEIVDPRPKGEENEQSND